MKLTKNERKFLKNAVSFGWKLQESVLHKVWHWDDDVAFPCYPSSTCDGLIQKGLLEKFRFSIASTIRATKLGYKYKCPINNCSHGTLNVYDDDGVMLSSGKCEKCEGLGIVSELQTGRLK